MLFSKRRNTFYFIRICLGVVPAQALLTDSLSYLSENEDDCGWYILVEILKYKFITFTGH